MSVALLNYAQARLGHPMVGGDELEQMGFVPGTMAYNWARNNIARIRQSRAQNYGVGFEEVGGMGDVIGADEETELAGIDEEIGALEDEEIGADEEDSPRGLMRLKEKLQEGKQKRQELSSKLASAPGWRVAYKSQLKLRVNRLDRVIDRLKRRIGRKEEKLAEKMGISVQELRSRTNGTSQSDFSEGGMAEQLFNVGLRTPAEGNEIRIPFLFNVSGVISPILRVTVPIATTPSEVAFTGTTRQFPYAGFRVMGLEGRIRHSAYLTTGGFINPEVLTTLLLTSAVVGGGINLLYDAAAVEFSGQTPNNGFRPIAGLRDNPNLDPNNTAVVGGTIRQELANSQAFTALVEVNLVCKRLYDPQATRKY